MKPLARKDDLIVQQSGDEVLVYDLNINKAISLNKTSALIWNHCDGQNSVSDIALIVKKAFDEAVTDEFVLFAIDQLTKENLLESKEDLDIRFGDMDRREVIRKIGYTSMIALPIVVSLSAPKAVHAQSCTPLAGGCQCNAFGFGGEMVGAICATDMAMGMPCATAVCICRRAAPLGTGLGDCVTN